jgi:C1A family cysteine protease
MWRMHLVIYKRLRPAVPAAIIVLLSSLLYAEGVKSSSETSHKGTLDTSSSMPEMPLMPDLSSPSMPVISAPTLGSSFYKPGENSPYTPTVTTDTTATEKKSSEKKSAVSLSEATAANSAAALSPAGINALSSSVSASDLSSLQNEGLLGNLYSILENSSGTASPLSNSADNASTDSLLTNILQQLKEIKQLSADKAVPDTDSASKSAVRTDSSQPAILRFVVNGYDILSTCRTTYFSKQENDGTFLLTGDRKYTSDGRTRNETFYLLFKTTGSTGFSTQYAVEPAVVQDYTNKYSFVYQLAHMQKLSAVKTGNLITMRLNEPSYNMDLLIDTGSKAK